jgi:hypothetical protein
MRWGIRSRSGSKTPPSEDAQKAKVHLAVVKRSGTKALSNKDLQELVTRMNLEQQYANLSGKTSGGVSSKIAVGQKHAKTVIGLGKTANDVVTFAQSPTGKAIAAGIKSAATKTK